MSRDDDFNLMESIVAKKTNLKVNILVNYYFVEAHFSLEEYNPDWSVPMRALARGSFVNYDSSKGIVTSGFRPEVALLDFSDSVDHQCEQDHQARDGDQIPRGRKDVLGHDL